MTTAPMVKMQMLEEAPSLATRASPRELVRVPSSARRAPTVTTTRGPDPQQVKARSAGREEGPFAFPSPKAGLVACYLAALLLPTQAHRQESAWTCKAGKRWDMRVSCKRACDSRSTRSFCSPGKPRVLSKGIVNVWLLLLTLSEQDAISELSGVGAEKEGGGPMIHAPERSRIRNSRNPPPLRLLSNDATVRECIC